MTFRTKSTFRRANVAFDNFVRETINLVFSDEEAIISFKIQQPLDSGATAVAKISCQYSNL